MMTTIGNWRPANIMQAEDRIYRIGQTKPVMNINQFETMPNVTAPIVAPRYQSNWTDQMVKWLNSHQKDFRDPEDWCEWIVSLAPSICDSWGDTYKAERVRMMLIQRIASMQNMLGEFPQDQTKAAMSYFQRINAAIDNWAS